MSGEGTHEVIIHVGDVAAAVAFYTEVCGLRHVRDLDHDGATLAQLDADGLRVLLVAAAGPGMQLSLPTADAEADEGRVKAAGATVHGPPEQVGSGVWLSFEDPWGNRLGFWQDMHERDEQENSPAR